MDHQFQITCNIILYIQFIRFSYTVDSEAMRVKHIIYWVPLKSNFEVIDFFRRIVYQLCVYGFISIHQSNKLFWVIFSEHVLWPFLFT